MTDHANFRQRLDVTLRTRNVQTVSAFLITEDQWSPGTPADPEFAMWMMIAGSPTLKDLHAEARRWLVEHGHAEEAEVVLSRARGNSNKPGSGQRKRPGAGGQPNLGQRGAKTSELHDNKQHL